MKPLRQHDPFARFGVESIVTHYRITSSDFFVDYQARGLPPIDVAFIDGSHAFDDVKHDFASALRHSHKRSYIMLHDTNIYVRELVRHSGVKRWLKILKAKNDLFEVVDFPFSSGVAIVRPLTDDAWKDLQQDSPRWAWPAARRLTSSGGNSGSGATRLVRLQQEMVFFLPRTAQWSM